MNFETYYGFINALLNLETGWPGIFWLNQNLRTLKDLKEFALKHKNEYKKENIDVEYVYIQIDNYLDQLSNIDSISQEFDERALLLARDYALQNKRIISSNRNKNLNEYYSQKDIEIEHLRFIYDVLVDLGYFYLERFDDLPCRNALYNLLPELLLTAQKAHNVSDNVHFNPDTLFIRTLRKIKKIKDAKKGAEIASMYNLTPSNQKNIEAMLKLKEFFNSNI